MSATISFKSKTLGCNTCMRLKASSWRVIETARSDARWICSRLRPVRRHPRPGDPAARSRCASRMMVSRLLKSSTRLRRGKPADGFHLVRLPQPLLQQLLVVLRFL